MPELAALQCRHEMRITNQVLEAFQRGLRCLCVVSLRRQRRPLRHDPVLEGVFYDPTSLVGTSDGSRHDFFQCAPRVKQLMPQGSVRRSTNESEQFGVRQLGSHFRSSLEFVEIIERLTQTRTEGSDEALYGESGDPANEPINKANIEVRTPRMLDSVDRPAFATRRHERRLQVGADILSSYAGRPQAFR